MIAILCIVISMILNIEDFFKNQLQGTTLGPSEAPNKVNIIESTKKYIYKLKQKTM